MPNPIDRIIIEPTNKLHNAVVITGYVGIVQAGSLILNPDTGEIEWVGVAARFRRQGVARALIRHARTAGYRPRHSTCRTPEGDQWAHSVGGHVPPLHTLPCAACGQIDP